MTVMARLPNYSAAKDVLGKIRKNYGIEIIWREDKKSTTILLKAVKNNKMICALIDQDTNLENGFSNFFGVEAAYPTAPIQLALRFNRPIFLSNIIRLPNGKYKLLVRRIFWEDKENPTQYILDEYSKNLETLICEFPGQWVWWHRRWRRRPNINYKEGNHKLRSTREYVEWIKDQWEK